MRYTISLCAATFAACTAIARAEVPVVVTDIPPVHSLVAQVMGDLGAPVLLLDRGADAHDFQLRPSQVAALSGAGLVVWIGPQMSPWLDRALDGTETGAAQLALLAVPGTERRAYGEAVGHDDHAGGEDDHDHARGEDDHDHAGEEEGHDNHAGGEDGHDDHGHVGTDPHAWLDPGNAAVWLAAIAGELARLDPENAAVYAANATTATAALDALDAEIAARLAPVADHPVVVFHDAYGHFAAHYGVTVLGAIALGDAASPGAAHLAGLQAEAGAAGCIFPEANHDADLATQLAEATGARLGPALDPEGSALEPGPGLYAALMRGLAEGMSSCLSAD